MSADNSDSVKLSDLDIDLLSAIARIRQYHDTEWADLGERLIECDLPRLLGHVTPEGRAWAAEHFPEVFGVNGSATPPADAGVRLGLSAVVPIGDDGSHRTEWWAWAPAVPSPAYLTQVTLHVGGAMLAAYSLVAPWVFSDDDEGDDYDDSDLETGD